jgi:hypothetical protein
LGDELLIIPQEIETDLLTPNFTGRLVQAEPYNGGNIASRFIHAYESHNNSSIPILYATPENTDQLKLRN